MSYTPITSSLRPKARPETVTESLRPKSRSQGLASREVAKEPEEEKSFWDYFDFFGGSTSDDDTASPSDRASKLYERDNMQEALEARPGYRSSPVEMLKDAYVGSVGESFSPAYLGDVPEAFKQAKALTPPPVTTTEIDQKVFTGIMAPPVQDTVSEAATEEEETNTSSRFDSKGLTPITLTDKAQEKLFDLGFVGVGTADGVAGANTRSAVRKYQGASDLTVNGRLDGDTLGGLTSATADLDTIMQRQIAFHEGQKNYPYKDSLGLWTIGVGHLIGTGSDEDLANSGYSQYSKSNPMSDSEVTELFQEDLTDHKAIAEGYDFYDDMNEKGKRAIIDLTFNMGDFLNKRNKNGTYVWANLREQLSNSDWDAAADNLASATYARQVGQRAITVTDMLRQAGD